MNTFSKNIFICFSLTCFILVGAACSAATDVPTKESPASEGYTINLRTLIEQSKKKIEEANHKLQEQAKENPIQGLEKKAKKSYKQTTKIHQNKDQLKKDQMAREEQRQTNLNQRAESLYRQALQFYRDKMFAAARIKFNQVQWVFPQYKSTADYLSRIDNDIKNQENLSQKHEKKSEKLEKQSDQEAKQESAPRKKRHGHDQAEKNNNHGIIQTNEKRGVENKKPAPTKPSISKEQKIQQQDRLDREKASQFARLVKAEKIASVRGAKQKARKQKKEAKPTNFAGVLLKDDHAKGKIPARQQAIK